VAPGLQLDRDFDSHGRQRQVDAIFDEAPSTCLR